jgi:hypothetical protein
VHHWDFNWDRVVSCSETWKDGIKSVRYRLSLPPDCYVPTSFK